MNKKTLLYTLSGIIGLAAILYFVLGNSYNYKILDEIYEESEGGNITFLFIHVDKLDSAKIYETGKKLFQERVLDRYKDDSKMSKDHWHEMMPPDVLIAYFYKQDDTTEVPAQMVDMLRRKYPRNDMVKYHLNMISDGYVYSGLYNPFTKRVGIDSLSPRTMLFVPKGGKIAKKLMDSMKEMPQDHFHGGEMEMDSAQMKMFMENHPKIEMTPDGMKK